ncbi:MAG: glutaredoxin family protein [Candidatus Bathyarchaeota archaeon]|nr:MAG: glutaredoxin family protein [Candidatus Bathyarchaeota archaeon]
MRTRVSGRNHKHSVLVYALSTCAWCKRAKVFLRDNDIEFEYVDVDLCDEKEREEIRNDILTRGGRLSYPTIIVDDETVITGFHEDRMREVLEI